MNERILVDQTILTWAFRYCLGRRSYAVGDCINHLIEHWNDLNKPMQKLICKEIRTAIEQGDAGGKYDIEGWKRVLRKEEEDEQRI